MTSVKRRNDRYAGRGQNPIGSARGLSSASGCEQDHGAYYERSESEFEIEDGERRGSEIRRASSGATKSTINLERIAGELSDSPSDMPKLQASSGVIQGGLFMIKLSKIIQ